MGADETRTTLEDVIAPQISALQDSLSSTQEEVFDRLEDAEGDVNDALNAAAAATDATLAAAAAATDATLAAAAEERGEALSSQATLVEEQGDQIDDILSLLESHQDFIVRANETLYPDLPNVCRFIDGPSGTYEINPSGESGASFTTYCDMDRDGGGWTLYEMMASSGNAFTGQYWGESGYNEAALGRFGNSPNNMARLSADQINALFAASGDGHVKHRFHNNQDRWALTDIFGPERKVLDGYYDVAKATRAHPSHQGGWCRFTRDNSRLRCCGGNWRRYSANENEGRWCSGINGQSNNDCSGNNHGPLGDTYGCNVPGFRTFEGHLWWNYYGNRGTPCGGYGSYGCYGSRWIR